MHETQDILAPQIWYPGHLHHLPNKPNPSVRLREDKSDKCPVFLPITSRISDSERKALSQSGLHRWQETYLNA